jgi:N-acetylneuraminate epimerase
LLLMTSLSAAESLAWKSLPAIPDRSGFAGSYGGSSGGALLVGGGANFPDKMPWEGGSKVWHDRLFALDPGQASWREVGRLPHPAGYGVSIQTPEGVLLIGGGDAGRNFRSVWRLRWDGHAASFETLPELPCPVAMMAGALVGRMVYIAGGQEKPDATEASTAFFALDLDRLDAGWRSLDYLPGPPRFFATAGSDGVHFYLFGGAKLVPGPDGKPQREWLRDAWRYTPGSGWSRLADLPRTVVAAPSPAPWSQGRLLIVGGADDSQLNTPPERHPGFPREVFAYDPKADRWTTQGEVPFSLVTTPAILEPGRVIIPGGEKRPGVRSTEVWAANLP